MFVDWWKLYIYLEFYKFNLISIFIFQSFSKDVESGIEN